MIQKLNWHPNNVSSDSFHINFFIYWYLKPSIKKSFSEKDAYALYLSYATLDKSVAFVNDMLFQLPKRHIFGGFQWNMWLPVLIIFSFCAKNFQKICLHGN